MGRLGSAHRDDLGGDHPQIIDATIPLNNASQCTGQCAKDIAAYIMTGSESCGDAGQGARTGLVG